ncbi:MAG: hypothetical protein ACR2HR_00685 [Euzebya sp.]
MQRDDRHGRLSYPDLDFRRRPRDGYRTRDRDRFRQLCLQVIARLPEDVQGHLHGMELRIIDVLTAAAAAQDPPPMATVEFGSGHPVLSIHRRPLELGATSRGHLMLLITQAVPRALRVALGLPPAEDDVD